MSHIRNLQHRQGGEESIEWQHAAVGHQNPAQDGHRQQNDPKPIRGALGGTVNEVHREESQVVRIQHHQSLLGRDGGGQETGMAGVGSTRERECVCEGLGFEIGVRVDCRVLSSAAPTQSMHKLTA